MGNSEDKTKYLKFYMAILCNTLPFDFYLPYYNTCIEYDGVQHFKPIDYFGGEKEFELRKNK